jgi:hypothetical protein
VKVHVGMTLEPAIALGLVGDEVVEDNVEILAWVAAPRCAPSSRPGGSPAVLAGDQIQPAVPAARCDHRRSPLLDAALGHREGSRKRQRLRVR